MNFRPKHDLNRFCFCCFFLCGFLEVLPQCIQYPHPLRVAAVGSARYYMLLNLAGHHPSCTIWRGRRNVQGPMYHYLLTLKGTFTSVSKLTVAQACRKCACLAFAVYIYIIKSVYIYIYIYNYFLFISL